MAQFKFSFKKFDSVNSIKWWVCMLCNIDSYVIKNGDYKTTLYV